MIYKGFEIVEKATSLIGGEWTDRYEIRNPETGEWEQTPDTFRLVSEAKNHIDRLVEGGAS